MLVRKMSLLKSVYAFTTFAVVLSMTCKQILMGTIGGFPFTNL